MSFSEGFIKGLGKSVLSKPKAGLMNWVWRIVSVTLPIAAIWIGASELRIAATNRAPEKITAQQLSIQAPAAVWVEVTAADLDFENACYLKAKGGLEPTAALIPIKSAGAVTQGGLGELFSVKVLLHTSDPKYLDTANVPSSNDNLTLSGCVEQSSDISSSLLKIAQQQYGTKLSVGFLVLKDGERPSWLKGAAFVLIGLGWLTVTLNRLRHWFKRGTLAAAPVASATPPQLPPPLAPPTLPLPGNA